MNIILNAAVGAVDPKFSGLCVFKDSQRMHAANEEARARLMMIGGKYNVGLMKWTFPSGAGIQLGFADPSRYRGMIFDDIELDACVEPHPVYAFIKRPVYAFAKKKQSEYAFAKRRQRETESS